MAEPTPQIQIVSSVETGEILCGACTARAAEAAALRAKLERAEVQKAGDAHTIASLSYKLEELKRDKDAEAREHDLWDTALDLFALWCAAAAQAEGRSKPKRSKLTGERFWLVLPFLKSDGAAMIQRAIIGRTFDHYGADGSVRRANGSPIHYHEWERIVGPLGKDTARGNFEESANRAPSDWRERVKALGFEVADS